MANPWFRLYSEIINDPKVLILPEALRWRYVALLCIQCNDSYEKAPDDEISLSLRVTVDDWLETRKKLIERKLLNDDGSIAGWEKRQFISDVKDPTAAERQKRYRRKKNNERNAAVTSRLPESDTDTDTEGKQISQKEKGSGESGAAVTQETATPSASPPTPKNESNGTRLKKDWVLPKKWGEWVKSEDGRPELTDADIRMEANKFRDYWHSKAGKEARKADWLATWRNWIRGAHIKPGSAKGEKPWFLSSKGIEEEGGRRNIQQCDFNGFPAFKAAVYQAAGVTDDMVRAARADFPE